MRLYVDNIDKLVKALRGGKKVKMNKTEVLKLLKQVEEIRQKAEKNPVNYPIDYTIRLIQATIAERIQSKDRMEWIKEIRNI